MAKNKVKVLNDFGGLVYSTNPTAIPSDQATSVDTPAPHLQDLRVFIERKHRGGKEVSLITGFIGSDDELQQLAKNIKTKCGTGGSAKNGEIIIQGDHRDKILNLLHSLGYKAKKAGG
ncbi:MAG: hypothetical protein RIQ89_1013 [Bacteroidota bacterium]|jgi:translation initiation factor 1